MTRRIGIDFAGDHAQKSKCRSVPGATLARLGVGAWTIACPSPSALSPLARGALLEKVRGRGNPRQPIGSSRFGDALRQDYGAIAPYQSMRPVGTISAFEFRSSSYGREQRPPARSRVRFTPTDLLRRWHGHDLLGRMQRAPVRIFFFGASCSPVEGKCRPQIAQAADSSGKPRLYRRDPRPCLFDRAVRRLPG